MSAIAPPSFGPPSTAPRAVERPASELFRDLADEVGTLIHQEVRLATKELSGKVEYATKQMGFIVTGGVLAIGCLLALLATAVLGLGQLVPLWVAALIVTIAAGVLAYGLAMKGMNALKKMDPRPEQTLLSIEETKLWAHEQVR